MEDNKNLKQVYIGEEVCVDKIECSDNVKRRILDLGIVKGTKIKPVFRSPLGDPTAYEVRGVLISLREEETKKIYVH